MHKKHLNQEKAIARCEQVLEAAEKCFVENGFHKSSMAEISKAAGMSVGHIYNYFQNKEEIITTIINRQLAEFYTEISGKAFTKEERLRVLFSHFRKHLQECCDMKRLSLLFDIVAETGRNEEMAAAIKKYEEYLDNWLFELIKLYQPKEEEEELRSRVEAVALVLNGVKMRLIRNPNLDKDKLEQQIKMIITRLICCNTKEQKDYICEYK